ncbi:anti-sigma factor family protein [Rhabdothermincola sediminis]|uniref:anti-sigma factor family protein n=1 Tax=Rhabdothermincola sediminis TaxID=2751370 RepID=UPI001AA0255E|nr:hypothetical protein [Rhabdothermincola sediminis]
MTPPHLPPDDELVSAVLDGEASAEEEAQVLADPDARERLERFRELAARLRTPVAPLEPAVRAQLIDRALAARPSHGRHEDPDPAAHGRDQALPPPGPDRHPAMLAARSALAIAAAVAVAIATFALLRWDRTASHTDVASGPQPDRTETFAEVGAEIRGGTSPRDAATPEPTASGEERTPEAAPIGEPQLGTFTNAEDLRQAVREAYGTTGSTAQTPSGTAPDRRASDLPANTATMGPSPCAPLARTTEPSLGPWVYAAGLTYRGVTAYLDVFAPGDGSPAIVVVTAVEGCRILERFTL